MREIKGLLFDIGGVLYVGEHVIDGASETIYRLHEHYDMRFVTNTTRTNPKSVLEKLKGFGISIESKDLFTALDATRDFLISRDATMFPVMTDEAKEYLKGFVSSRPDFVVVADAYENFDYAHLNSAFRALMQGASLIAAAKNRYFKDKDEKLSMDAGGFVDALEYASGKQAIIIGKPSENFFHTAVSSMGFCPHEVLMVGDDIQSDIKGAQDARLQTALVKTGKFRVEDLQKGIYPDLILNDVSELTEHLLG